MSRRGYPDLPDKDNVGAIQARRRGYSDSKQILPLHIKVPPTTSLCELDGRFENPRKAPLPRGLKYNTVVNGDIQQFENIWSPGIGLRSVGISTLSIGVIAQVLKCRQSSRIYRKYQSSHSQDSIQKRKCERCRISGRNEIPGVVSLSYSERNPRNL
jgi:hypothetical protein